MFMYIIFMFLYMRVCLCFGIVVINTEGSGLGSVVHNVHYWGMSLPTYTPLLALAGMMHTLLLSCLLLLPTCCLGLVWPIVKAITAFVLYAAQCD